MSLTKLQTASCIATLAVGAVAQNDRPSSATLNGALQTTPVSESYKDSHKVLSIALPRMETATTSVQEWFFKANVLGEYGHAPRFPRAARMAH